MQMRCELCNEKSDDVSLHYLAKFQPLLLHHTCWALVQRLEMKLKPIRR